MRWIVGACLAVVALSGCGGSDDRPDLAASSTTLDEPVAVQATQTTADDSLPTSTAPTSIRVTPRQSRTIAMRADEIEAALANWDVRLDRCVGPSGNGDDAGASCIRAAWDQLFDQMDVAQYYLLQLVRPLRRGACHDSLASALDAVYGFLSGATPTEVVWLDEQQHPPSTFDLESIVDVVRPVPARMRDAAATTCSS